MKTTCILTLGLIVLAMSIFPMPALAQHHNHGDHWLFGIENGVAAVIEPEPDHMHEIHLYPHPVYASTWYGEWMVDFFHADGEEGDPQLSAVRVQRVDLSPGLLPGAYFGWGHDGYMDLTLESAHKHCHFYATTPGEYWMTFKLVNAFDFDGNPVSDSGIYTLEFEVVPEPSGMMALAAGCGSLLVFLRRRV